jgi:hypothetical protein
MTMAGRRSCRVCRTRRSSVVALKDANNCSHSPAMPFLSCSCRRYGASIAEREDPRSPCHLQSTVGATQCCFGSERIPRIAAAARLECIGCGNKWRVVTLPSLPLSCCRRRLFLRYAYSLKSRLRLSRWRELLESIKSSSQS